MLPVCFMNFCHTQGFRNVWQTAVCYSVPNQPNQVIKELENDHRNYPYFDAVHVYFWPDHRRAAGEIIGEGSHVSKNNGHTME